MTASDWERINQDTQSAIEIAEAGKKRTRGNGSDTERKMDADDER